MAVSVKVGTFTQKATTGTQAVAGLGFQPKALIVWTAGSSAASGTWQANYAAGIGFSGGASNSYCVASGSTSGVTGSACARRVAAHLMSLVNGALTVVCEADLSSFDVGGFTLNFTTTDGAARVFGYMAIGGTDVTNAAAVNFVPSGSAQNWSYTGLSFQPDLAFFGQISVGTIPQTSNAAIIEFGMMNAAGQQASCAIESLFGTNPSSTGRGQRTDACLHFAPAGGGAISVTEQFVAMLGNGFTLNLPIGDANQIVGLAIQGVSSRIGSFVTTATSPQTVAHVGFAPRGVIFASFASSPAATAYAGTFLEIGGDDGTNHVVSALSEAQAVAPTEVFSVWLNTASFVNFTGVNPPVTSTTGTISATTSDGFTMTYVSPAAGAEVVFCAIGDANVNTFPKTLP